MPKRDLSKQIGETRYTTQEAVQVQPDPIQAAMDALQQAPTQEGEHIPIPVEKQARTHARMKESKHTRKDVNMDWLYDRIQQRKHLSNGSFRYRPDELDTMDAIYRELEDKKPGRISKNDLARMALILLCQDYQDNGEQSTLSQIFQRM